MGNVFGRGEQSVNKEGSILDDPYTSRMLHQGSFRVNRLDYLTAAVESLLAVCPDALNQEPMKDYFKRADMYLQEYPHDEDRIREVEDDDTK
jgi:hypothetical protein